MEDENIDAWGYEIMYYSQNLRNTQNEQNKLPDHLHIKLLYRRWFFLFFKKLSCYSVFLNHLIKRFLHVRFICLKLLSYDLIILQIIQVTINIMCADDYTKWDRIWEKGPNACFFKFSNYLLF